MPVYLTFGELLRDFINQVIFVDSSELCTNLILDIMNIYKQKETQSGWEVNLSDEVVIQSLSQDYINQVHQRVVQSTFEAINANPLIQADLAIRREWWEAYKVWRDSLDN